MPTRHLRSDRSSNGQREIFPQAKVESRRNTLCISRLSKRRIGEKDPLIRRSAIVRRCPTKKGAGRMFHSPRCSSRFAYDALDQLWITPLTCSSGGQNLAAVGSSHSLTETVDLGTMTAAGLIGTLHNTFTSYYVVIYARQPKFGRSNTYFMTQLRHTEPV